MKSKKLSLLILPLILIVIITANKLIFNQTWQNYENTIYKYQLKYPPGWSINSKNAANTIFSTNNSDGKIIIRDTKIPYMSENTLFQYAINYKNQNNLTGKIEATNIIDGRKGLIITDLNKQTEAIFIKNDNNTIFEVILQNLKYEKIFLRILSTFHFINYDREHDTTYWKEISGGYTNMSFKYPQDWKFTIKESPNEYKFYSDKNYTLDEPEMIFSYKKTSKKIDDIKNKYSKYSLVKIEGKPAIKTENTLEMISGNNLIYFQAISKKGKSKFNKIISTVRFTD